MSILEELYYGNINTGERFIKKGSEYHNITRSVSEEESKLLKTLNDNQKSLYEHIFELKCKQEDICEIETFIDSFRLGAQFMLEIFSKRDGQFIYTTDVL